MYHSVTMISDIGYMRNTYTDWHLVPNGRPTIVMPSVKTTYVDIPGASGKLDLSESLTKYPLYDNRSGSLGFIVLNDYQTDETSWAQLYQEIAKFTHGRKLKIYLEDDENFYYEGRVSTTWDSDSSGGWSTVSFDYDLDPYKYWHEPMTATKQTNSAGERWRFGYEQLGSMPTIPKFAVSNVGSVGIDITLNNEELGIIDRTRHISTGGDYQFYDLILSNIHGNNVVTLDVVGSGYVHMRYTRGEL